MKFIKKSFFKTYFYLFYLVKKVHFTILKSVNKGGYNRLIHVKTKDYEPNWYSNEFWLADDYRIDIYNKAIKKYVKPGSAVIDMGTGLGIMAFLASQAGASKIYAIERSDIIDYAEILAKENGFKNIKFLKCDSKKASIPEKVDTIIHVQMGHFLFHVDMLEVLSDLRDRFLNEGGKIIPNKFKFYIEPAQLKYEWRVPYIWELDIHSINFSSLKNNRQGIEWGYNYNTIWPSNIDYLLSEPEPVIEFDLETFQIKDIPTNFTINRIIQNPGRLDGLYIYFDAIFDEELAISTNVNTDTYARSWKGILYRVESEEMARNSELEFSLTIEDFALPNTWNFTRTK